MKRMVTDPTTGERTAVCTTNSSGIVEWTHSKEEREDRERAQIKAAKKNAELAILRRAINT
jgi:hypothetical protein